MKEFGRREFLRLSTGAIVGTVVGNITPHIARDIDRSVQRVTGIRAGNAGGFQWQEQCSNNPSLEECNSSPPMAAEVIITSLNSLIEELTFRTLPSVLLSGTENAENPLAETAFGTGGFGMTKKELLVGAGTSIAFGAGHNFVRGGFDRKTIPAAQTFFGAMMWYLQRKFGVVSNTAAHTWHNLRA